MSKTNPARGMRDFLPTDIRKRNYVINIIREVYESYGFEPLETPAVENLETLMGKYGDEGNQLIYKILKRGEKLDKQLAEFGESKMFSESGNSQNSVNAPNTLADLALRYDLTVPLARVVANHRNGLPKFFKRYQIQPVWRADRPARGRFREFYQCDVDAIGSKSMVVEAELISAVSEILKRLGFEDFVIRINHREILNGLLELQIPKEKHNDALIALDKLDKIGLKGVANEFVERGIDKDSTARFLGVFAENLPKYFEQEKADYKDISSAHIDWNLKIYKLLTSRFANRSLEYKAAVSMWQMTKLLQSAEGKVKFDLSLARGLSYYTGAIFEINVPDLAGSLGGGGRYDGLIGMFGKEQIPACGFSLGLERILVVMDERGMFPSEVAASAAADIMVTIQNDETIAGSLRLAAELRKSGLRVLVYPEAEKLGKQFKYADSLNIKYACVPGEDSIKLKDLATGEQSELSVNDIVQLIRGE